MIPTVSSFGGRRTGERGPPALTPSSSRSTIASIGDVSTLSDSPLGGGCFSAPKNASTAPSPLRSNVLLTSPSFQDAGLLRGCPSFHDDISVCYGAVPGCSYSGSTPFMGNTLGVQERFMVNTPGVLNNVNFPSVLSPGTSMHQQFWTAPFLHHDSLPSVNDHATPSDIKIRVSEIPIINVGSNQAITATMGNVLGIEPQAAQERLQQTSAEEDQCRERGAIKSWLGGGIEIPRCGRCRCTLAQNRDPLFPDPYSVLESHLIVPSPSIITCRCSITPPSSRSGSRQLVHFRQ